MLEFDRKLFSVKNPSFYGSKIGVKFDEIFIFGDLIISKILSVSLHHK